MKLWKYFLIAVPIRLTVMLTEGSGNAIWWAIPLFALVVWWAYRDISQWLRGRKLKQEAKLNAKQE